MNRDPQVLHQASDSPLSFLLPHSRRRLPCLQGRGAPQGLWILGVLLVLVGLGCNNEYGQIGLSQIQARSVAVGDLSLVAGTPGGSGSAEGTGVRARMNQPVDAVLLGGILYVTDRNNHVIRAVDPWTREVRTLAGSPGIPGRDDGVGVEARFFSPEGLTTDGRYLYVADTANHAIRRVDPQTGEVITLAGRRGQPGALDSTNGQGDTATFRGPGDLTYLDGYLYVADSDNHLIRRVDPLTGETTTLAGVARTAGYLDAPGTLAQFNLPLGIMGDPQAGILYVADTLNHRIRRIDPQSGEVTTVAGTGNPGWADGSALEALLNAPVGLALYQDPNGRRWLLFSDRDNALIRALSLETGLVRTLAGSPGVVGAEDGLFQNSRFWAPQGLALEGDRVFVADTGNHVIRILDLALGTVDTLVGMAPHPGSEDGGPGEGRLSGAQAVTTDGRFLYIADTQNHTIRVLDPETRELVTVAGSPGLPGSTDSTVSPAYFDTPGDVALDEAETQIFIADTNNHAIRRMFLDTGQVETFAGFRGLPGTADGPFGENRFQEPHSLVRLGEYLYVADSGNHTLRRIHIPTREVTTLAGHPGEAGIGDGIGTEAYFNHPWDLATDGHDLYVADRDNHAIRRVDPQTGEVSTLVGVLGHGGFVDSGELDPSTGEATPLLSQPSGVAWAPDPQNPASPGLLYISDAGNYAIRVFDLATGTLTHLAGDRSCESEITTVNGEPVEVFRCSGTPTGVSAFVDSEDGTGLTASFGQPAGLAVLGEFVWVMDRGNHTLRRVHRITGETVTVAGGEGFADGKGRSSRMEGPSGVALVGTHLYFAESGGHLIRMADLADPEAPEVVTLAGNASVPGKRNALGYEARFNQPSGIAVDEEGNLYVSDTGNHTIRKLTRPETAGGAWRVTTLAGIPGRSGYVNTAFGLPRFNAPRGIVYDTGRLFVADTGNHVIRRITLASGRVSLVAGHGDVRTQTGTPGTEDSTGQAAGLNAPRDLVTAGDYLYVVDTGNHTVRRILKVTGEVRTIAGMPQEPGYADGVGFEARLNAPWAITWDGRYLYVADTGNRVLRRVDPLTREVITLVGDPGQAAFVPGPAPAIRFNLLADLVTRPSWKELFLLDARENVLGRLILE